MTPDYTKALFQSQATVAPFAGPAPDEMDVQQHRASK